VCNGGIAEGKVDLVTGSSEDGLAPAFMETSAIIIEDAWRVVHVDGYGLPGQVRVRVE